MFSQLSANGSSGAGTPPPRPVGSSSFDLSDFPSLGGVGAGSTNDGLAAALRQQQQLLVQEQMMQQGTKASSSLYRLATQAGEQAAINIAAEDFPALPGASAPLPPGSGIEGIVGGDTNRDPSIAMTQSSSPFLGATPTVSRASSSMSGGLGLFGAEVDGMIGQKQLEALVGRRVEEGVGKIGGTPSRTIGSRSSAAVTQSSSKVPPSGGIVTAVISGSSGGGTALSSEYGLLGLLSVIRMTDADRNALALGSDLTALGMNLNSSDKLYSTFASPWSESPTTKDPQYQLPMCYYTQPPALKTGHLCKFQLETLFYIFYAFPKDVLQAHAAQELYSREWRYHIDLKLWFKKAGPSDGLTATTNGGDQYIFFDVNTWERRLFNGNVQNMTAGLLSENPNAAA